MNYVQIIYDNMDFIIIFFSIIWLLIKTIKIGNKLDKMENEIIIIESKLNCIIYGNQD